MWIFGFHPIRETLRGRPQEVIRVLVSRSRSDARATEIEALCVAAGVLCVEVDESEISRHVDGVHNGLAAEVEAPVAKGGVGNELVVLVEDIQDPRNLGALIRVCEGAGVDRLLVRDRGSTALTPAVVKTSAGAAEWVEVERVTNSANELERLKADGYWVYGAAPGGVAPWDVDLTGKVVICVGGEEKGLRQRTRQICDQLIELPMAGRVESLNLATAAAAILYDIVRQRAAADS